MGDENAWVFDSLICFLHGPVWNAPILNFIEEKSIIFDPNNEDHDNEEFGRLHHEYKNLVDFMLGSFMEEMCISPEQFEIACLEGKSEQDHGLPLPFQKGLFQQIWAANDLNKFIDMMKKRNIEIQLQALELIERKRDPKSCITSEDEALKEIIEQDIDETSLINEVSAESIQIAKLLDDEAVLKNKCTEENTSHESSMNNTIKNLTFNKKQIDASELDERKKYLNAQRDKLIALKRQIRSKKLVENEIMASRPMSSKVQQIINGTARVDDQSELQDIDKNQLNITLRKTLANRLKQEVVKADQQSSSSSSTKT